MAQQEARIDPDKLSCSICSELLKDPVTLPCGHNYCLRCISKHWDHEEMTARQNFVSCPMCRKNFNRRPELGKNTMLADLIEELKKTRDAVRMGTITKRRVSLFDEENKPKKNKRIDTGVSRQNNICSQHNEEKKIFCRTEQQCICYLCHLDQHKGHDTVSAEAEMSQRRKELEAGRQTTVEIIQGIEKDIVLLQQKVQDTNRSADEMVKENEKMTTEVVTHIKNMSSNLTHKIRARQMSDSNQLYALLRIKEKEREAQKQRLESTNLDKLLNTVSYTQFLEKHQGPFKFGELSGRINLPPLLDFQSLKNTLSRQKGKIKTACTEMFTYLEQMVVPVNTQCSKTTENLCDYSVQLVLDPTTVSKHLKLSENKRKVTSVMEAQPYAPYLNRFQSKDQVLTTDPLPARCYWEVEWSGLGVSVGVAYNDIRRTGPDSGFGNNDKSWVLDCTINESYVYRHKSGRRTLSPCQSCRVGVYVDHKAGLLRFYQVSETNKLIHEVNIKFTQPLYAGIGVNYYGATAEMCVKEKGNRN
ncbi:hypothetical protein WMY93_020483 [Mugilogobius chulae]|uniref:Tripartite motif-containing protein 16-like n=1 Tax=Mugilogobius chulae TaxID=88201 RepID=A0AAW0NM64_9GOBI